MKTLAKLRESIEAINIPRGEISLPRHHMPQIKKVYFNEFFYLLNLRGIAVIRTWVLAQNLRTAQSEIDLDKIREWVKSMPPGAEDKPCIISQDNYVLDGNHTWLSKLNRDPECLIDCFVIGLDMDELLNTCRLFDKVTYKTIDEETNAI